MNTVAIIQARMDSTRLPGKVLTDLAGRPVLAWVVDAATAIPGVDGVAVATSVESSDDPIAAWCEANAVRCRRGSKGDVLDRMIRAAEAEKADVVVRLTADCPLLDPAVCGQVVLLRKRTGADYASNTRPCNWPDGLDCEVVTSAVLSQAGEEARLPSQREHVTPWFRGNRARLKVRYLPCPIPGLETERWTLDTEQDLVFLRAVAERLPAGRPPSFMDVLAVLEKEPELRAINADFSPTAKRKRVALEDFASKAYRKRSYARSSALLAQVERLIPLGSQTFSKSRIVLPVGRSPLFLTHGLGGHVWDVDGNEYVDMVCGLLPVVLGYCDADVDAAIREQLDRGISFSLATELEMELAERLTRLIPCAEKVRFGKNGTDATSAAVRLARAKTGRDRIAVSGYHGWQDWYIGVTTRNKGVPDAVSNLTHKFAFDDIASLHRLLNDHPGEFAAVVMEPFTDEEPAEDTLGAVKELAHQHGALLVFDEIVTGFRLALGGAQALFGVTPDLACFGKALGNGMPISAVVGRADVMNEMEEIFFSATFGGEALSLAAAIAVIDKMEREPVIERLWSFGRRLADEVTARIAARNLDDVIELNGAPPWKLIKVSGHSRARAQAIRTLFMREMIENGVLISASHNVCYAHDDADMAVVLGAYERTLDVIADELDTGRLEERLGCPVIQPIFAVRENA